MKKNSKRSAGGQFAAAPLLGVVIIREVTQRSTGGEQSYSSKIHSSSVHFSKPYTFSKAPPRSMVCVTIPQIEKKLRRLSLRQYEGALVQMVNFFVRSCAMCGKTPNVRMSEGADK